MTIPGGLLSGIAGNDLVVYATAATYQISGNCTVNCTANHWGAWSSDYTACTTQQVWLEWVGTPSGPWTPVVNAQRPPTAEEINRLHAQIAEQQAAWAAQNAEREAKLRTARAKARELLLEVLDAQQRAEYEAMGDFVVAGKSGALYRLRHGNHLDQLDEHRKPVAEWCVGPSGALAPEDQLLARKLHLEADDVALLRVANRHAVSPAALQRAA